VVQNSILTHTCIGLDTDVHFIGSQFSILASDLLLITEAFPICPVETILELVLIALDMILYHSAVLLFEFVGLVSVFKSLTTAISGELDSSLGTIALDRCWCHPLRKLTTYSSITVHQVEVVLV
jgi:hypothetical protein